MFAIFIYYTFKRDKMDNNSNPLHGIKLAEILDKLVEHYG